MELSINNKHMSGEYGGPLVQVVFQYEDGSEVRIGHNECEFFDEPNTPELIAGTKEALGALTVRSE